MATEAELIAKLKAEQGKYALQALRNPNHRDEFEYGYRVGVLAGLTQAENLLLELIKEENARDI
jgi:hypothetical protein